MIDLNDVQVFAAVVDNRGFTAAARALGVPKSSVSRNVARLEVRLGVRLLQRSTRSIGLTEAGAEYFARCREALIVIEQADQDAVRTNSEPRGTVRVSCPTGIAEYGIAEMIPAFMARYPKVKVQLMATNRAVDLIEDRIDVAIRARHQLTEEAVTVRRLGLSRQILVASQRFAAAQGLGDDPSGLGNIPFLSFQEETARPSWTLVADGREPRTVVFDPVLWTSNFRLLLEAAAADTGIALLPEEVVEPDIMRGRLIRVLPSWRTEDVIIHLVFFTRRGLAPAVRAFIDALTETYAANRAGRRPFPARP